MAGAGYKLFNTGDVLTAAQVNTYLQEQVVMVFANATARTTALSGVLAEGMVSYLKDTDALEIYSGTAWVGYGSGDITGVTAGTGISGGGTSGTVTITNDMATTITAAGDIVVGTGSGTYDNLPIGTTGQVLTADTTVSPYKVKWASASAGALTLITRSSFSNVAGVNIDSIFSSTYKSYLVVIENLYAGTSTDDLLMQVRYGSTTFTSANYYLSSLRTIYSNTTSTVDNTSGGTSFTLTRAAGDSTFQNAGTLNFSMVGDTATRPLFNYQIWTGEWAAYTGGGVVDSTANTITGLRFLSTSTNIWGNIAVYGRS